MLTYRIHTGGPVITKNFDSAAAMRRFVEENAPLKRGWTGEWQSHGGFHMYRRFNSNGKPVKGYDITANMIGSGRRMSSGYARGQR